MLASGRETGGADVRCSTGFVTGLGGAIGLGGAAEVGGRDGVAATAGGGADGMVGFATGIGGVDRADRSELASSESAMLPVVTRPPSAAAAICMCSVPTVASPQTAATLSASAASALICRGTPRARTAISRQLFFENRVGPSPPATLTR